MKFFILLSLENLKCNIFMDQQIIVVLSDFILKEHASNFLNFANGTLQRQSVDVLSFDFSICLYIIVQGGEISTKVKHFY